MTMRLYVGTAPERMECQGLWLDGQSALPKTALIWLDDNARALVIEAEGQIYKWAHDDVRAVPDQAGHDLLILRRRDDPLQRVVVTNPAFANRFPDLYRAAPVTRRGPLLTWAVAAVASVLLIVFVLVPRMADQLAVFIPPAGERALGTATLNQIRSAMDQTGMNPVPICESPKGIAALQKMAGRLESAMQDNSDLSVYVLDHPMVNAFALPGGNIVFFRGLIDKADAPEQVAAVFAHEIGHVISRDPTRHALRSAGSIGVLGLLFGDFAGGALVLFLTERLIAAQYTQEAEQRADDFAHQVLREAKIRPDALADMFDRFGTGPASETGLRDHFQSHPAMGDRMAAARAATPDGMMTEQVLTPEDWTALKSICR